MAKLTAKARKKLPKSAFAGPGRSYPVNDRAHAANAKARATQQVKAGNLAPAQAAAIKTKANKVLKTKGTPVAKKKVVAKKTAKKGTLPPGLAKYLAAKKGK
jgi:hypothetical protein